ncbi:hypothetical protein MHTCC0001_14140 [Flavobacteriaceae bacterium MHTCC 0001]
MKSTFLTLITYLIVFTGDTSTSSILENGNSKFNNAFIEKNYNVNPIDEIEDNDFILSTLEEKVNYQTINDQFDLSINSERSFPNRFDESKTYKEVTVSLLNNSSTIFSYYLSHSKNIFLKGIIYTDQLTLANGVKVGMNRVEIGQIFNCKLDTTKNKFRIYDIDDLIEVILNFDSTGKIFAIKINTSGYVS